MKEEVVSAVEKARDATGIVERPLRLLLAVSGGRDSAALLHLLVALNSELSLELAVAHVNHGLRDASNQEAEFVAAAADRLGISFLPHSIDEPRPSADIEAWARSRRYAFLQQCLDELGFDFIVTAHHRNDLAETVLMRACSGRLASDSRTIAFLDTERRLFRPLLGVERAAIDAYVKEFAVSYVEDESNDNLRFTRNRIRANLLPTIQREFNVGAVSSLGLLAEKLNEDESYLWQEAEQWKSRLNFKKGFESKQWKQIPAALRWRLLRLLAAEELGAEAGKIGRRLLAHLSEELSARNYGQSEFDLGHGFVCRFKRGQPLYFFDKNKQ